MARLGALTTAAVPFFFFLGPEGLDCGLLKGVLLVSSAAGASGMGVSSSRLGREAARGGSELMIPSPFSPD